MQAMGAVPTMDNPGVPQQWVPQDIASQVQMVQVKARRGQGGVLPLTRQLVGVDFIRGSAASSPGTSVLPTTAPGKAVSCLCGMRAQALPWLNRASDQCTLAILIRQLLMAMP